MVSYLPEIEYFFASLTFYAFGYVFVDFIFKKNIAHRNNGRRFSVGFIYFFN